MGPFRILVVDDEPSIGRMFRRGLDDRFDVSVATDGNLGLAALGEREFDVVVSDIHMPGADGLVLLKEARQRYPETVVILMTGHATVDRAVEAMRQGAYHYLAKPFTLAQATLWLERAVEHRELRLQAREWSDGRSSGDMIGSGPAMRRIAALVRRAANTDTTVLITGESGTGKEVAARAVHALGGRRRRRFVAVNCGALPEALVESELFGHTKGAFTGAIGDTVGLFEEADGGTLFLDEVGELALPLQVKLTRVLQEGVLRRVGDTRERSVDVRVLAATNRSLEDEIASGRFREDLYYRLNVFSLELPPLRERAEDIPALAAFLLARHRRASTAHVEGFQPEALAAMTRYRWPGNVRELENTVLRALAVCDSPRIRKADLPPEVVAGQSSGHEAAALTSLPYRDALAVAKERASNRYLTSLLRELGGSVTLAARRAGMERESLHRLLKRHSIRAGDYRLGGLGASTGGGDDGEP